MLLGHSHTLEYGLRVRVRLAHVTDVEALLDLAARAGRPCGELAARRMLRVEPRVRVAVCAAAWVDGRQTLVGYGAGDLAAGEPDVLLCDDALAPGVGALLAAAVAERAGVLQRSVA